MILDEPVVHILLGARHRVKLVDSLGELLQLRLDLVDILLITAGAVEAAHQKFL